MGKAGRIACIFTPYVLTIASLICIIMVGLGCTKASDSNLTDLYFIRVNMQNITSSGSKTVQEVEDVLNKAGISNVNKSQVSDVLSKLQDDSTLNDFYTIGLWGYCDGDISGGNKYTTTYCSKPKGAFYFDPLKVWGLEDTSIKDELPGDYTKIMKIYKSVSKWQFVAYVVAFVATILEILLGIFAICSRWGSCVTTLASVVAFLFTTAAAITSTVLFSIFKSSLGPVLKAYGIYLDLGKNMLAATWLAVVFALGAVLFWTLSVCCCSGRSPYNHKDNRHKGGVTAEKAPYTYEPLGAGSAQPYGHHHSTSYPPPAHPNEYPMTNQPGRTHVYEPFRHV